MLNPRARSSTSATTAATITDAPHPIARICPPLPVAQIRSSPCLDHHVRPIAMAAVMNDDRHPGSPIRYAAGTDSDAPFLSAARLCVPFGCKL